jgi:hypothetical protein
MKISALAIAIALALCTLPQLAAAFPSGEAKIVPQGNRCVRISTAGVDHGKAVAQKFADDLLAADIAAFKKRRHLQSLRIQRRFRKCNYHLWFFGDEYNCTSLAVACW